MYLSMCTFIGIHDPGGEGLGLDDEGLGRSSVHGHTPAEGCMV
jgi:hypothetical protein